MLESVLTYLTEPEIKRLLVLLDKALVDRVSTSLDLPLEGKLEDALEGARMEVEAKHEGTLMAAGSSPPLADCA